MALLQQLSETLQKNDAETKRKQSLTRQERYLETVKGMLEMAKDNSVTPEDVVKLFEALKQALTKVRDDIENKNSAVEVALTEKINAVLADLNNKYDTFKTEQKSDARTALRLLQQQVSDLRSDLFNAIPDEYDDSELRESLQIEIQTLKNSIPELPEEYDDQWIKDKLEELENKLKELEKRPVGTGGGVTNARIAQAFKYVLKTEQPVGDIDGINTTYTVSQPIFAILSLSINGETIAQLPNYTINGNSFTFSSALPAAYSGKDWEIKYV